MTDAPTATLGLTRADSGPDLWTAIEAAQYSRIVDHEAPRNDAEAAAMADLVDLFTDCAERWEQHSAAEQQTALTRIGNRLAALREMGLFAYSGTTLVRVDGQAGETADIPLAVLIVWRDFHNIVDIALPLSRDAD